MEEIQLISSDLYKSSSIPRKCIRTLPQGKTKLQKLVLGDDQGSILVLDFSSEQTQIESKYQQSTKEVSMVELANQPTGEKDRIFYCSSSHVIGLTKKAKEFLKYDTQLADSIKHLVIEGNFLFTAGDYILNQYQMLNDQVTPLTFYLCPDKINDMAAHYIQGQQKVNIILACQDSCVRVLHNDDIQYEFSVEAPVSCMEIFSPQYNEIISSKRSEQRKCFVYGLEDGSIIVADMTMVKAVILIKFKTQSNNKKLTFLDSGINLLRPCNYFRTGQTDLAVVRNDGVIELYSLEENNQFELKASKKINEAITGIETGNFKNANECEFIITTFSGRVLLIKGNDSRKDDKKIFKDQEAKIKQLKQDIAKLEVQYQELSVKNSKDTTGMIYANTFKVNSRLTKNDVDGTYSWLIDSQYSIELMTIQSSIKFEILNTDEDLIISLVDNDMDTQACFRMKVQNKKILEIKFRTREGQSGNMCGFIIPDSNPKTSQQVNIEIKPLSLHSKVSEEIKIKHLPLNTLNIKGTFTKTYMNMWINCLVPDLPNSDEESVEYLFKNIFTETILQIKYKQGQALIKSDSVISLQICKTYIVEQANLRGVQIDVKWDVNDQSIQSMFSKLLIKFQEHQTIEKQFLMLPALKEMKASDTDISYLSNEFIQILENEESIIKQHSQLPKRLDFLINIVVDMYNSRCVLKGSKPNVQKQDFIGIQLLKHSYENIVQTILSE